ncbi:hypothetical protein Purlil1_12172 [Purpureocillium lilacinum]|uniref:Uncharacterized protein n=1 Tax=Purpureocillium lilacinum TaxID=33203 RepID=A0ABR0BI77_PURLI|nr:hypothetical protein Purlil1_12172 [Purpureocillium lilacinum]
MLRCFALESAHVLLDCLAPTPLFLSASFSGLYLTQKVPYLDFNLAFPCLGRNFVFHIDSLFRGLGKRQNGASSARQQQLDVHPRWHLREPTSHNPYRRILDPKIAASLRGRPKNAAQPVPESMNVQLSTRTRAAVGKTGTGKKPTRKSALLGSAVRMDVVSDEEKREARLKRRRRSSRKQSAISVAPVPSGSTGEENHKDCIHVQP